MQDTELHSRIEECKETERELKQKNSSRIGRHNNLEELYILKSIEEFRSQF